MSSIATILSQKGQNVESISATNTVFEAVCKMVQHDLGALVVVELENVIGIITERDYLRKVAVEGRSSKSTFVAEIMTSHPVCVDSTSTADDCLRLMSKHTIRHLPVVDSGRLTGVLSVRDVVNHLVKEREQTIVELTHYIQGSYT